MTTQPLPAENLAAIRESLQFGEAPLLPLPFMQTADDNIIRVVEPGGGSETYLRISVPVATTPWRFEYLMPVTEAVAAGRRQAQLLALLLIGVATIASAIWLRRRQTALAGTARDQAAREELERRVV